MSRFLLEVPKKFQQPLDDRSGPPGAVPDVDLFAEQHAVRATVRKNTYTGKTYNSLENIAQFFQERGLQPPPPKTKRPAPVLRQTPAAKPPARRPKGKFRTGVMVEHPRYGRGMVLRREGDGEDAKLTVNFPSHGLKKMVVKYAGLKVTE